jgi:hypothetical protein
VTSNVIKKVKRYNKYKDFENLYIKYVGKVSPLTSVFDKMYVTPQMITTSIKLYFTGESSKYIKQFLKL